VNAAVVREQLAALLPAGVAVETAIPGDDCGPALPAELAAVAKAVPARRAEFLLGRALARAALRRIGVEAGEIPARPDRSPEWPADVVGSISHTRALCAVAVARRGAIVSLGLDLEQHAPLEPELWRRVLTPDEQAWIRRAPPAEQGGLAKLVFSAKEAFYKCQYPLTARFLDFLDVELELDVAERRFSVRTDRVALPVDARFSGRWVASMGHVCAVASLTRS
jgi:4'-phosphopantetheinyl transferase EntD